MSIFRVVAFAALCALGAAGAPAQTNAAAFTLQYSFDYASGDYPGSAPVVGADGMLYGTATGNGRDFYGSLYRRGPGGRIVIMHWFDLATGSPDAHLTALPDRSLWGTASGGANGRGAVFRFDPQSRTVRLVHSFDRSDGVAPIGRLLRASDGNLYGTTQRGGGTGFMGTLYRVEPASGLFTSLHAFARDAHDIGISPNTGLVEGPDGKLYGSTYSTFGYGTTGSLFSFDPVTYEVSPVHRFNADTDGGPSASELLAAPNGCLYGTTPVQGGAGYGTLFSFETNGAFTVLHTFTAAEGSPSGGLALASDGYLYGVTSFGGLGDGGIAYRIAPDGRGFTVVTNFGWGDAMAGSRAGGEFTEYQGALWGTTTDGGTGAPDGTLYTLAPRRGG